MDAEMREVIARLQRFIEGEKVSTLYVLPAGRALNPLRADVSALLAAWNTRATQGGSPARDPAQATQVSSGLAVNAEELRKVADAASIDGVVKWFADLAPTDEVLAIDHVGAVTVVAKVNPMAEWNDETAAAWTAFIATFDPPTVLSLATENARLRAAWDWLSSRNDLSLDYDWPNDEDPGEWRVHRVTGNVNDREWDEISTAPTALEAVLAARAALSPKQSEGEG